MLNVLVRDIEASVIERLKLRVKKQNRSLQSEMKLILSDAADRPEPLSELEVVQKNKASLRSLPRTDSIELLREDRS